MASTLSFIRNHPSANRWPDEPSDDAPLQPVDLDDDSRFSRTRPPRGKRASRGFTRFLITFCVGVAATLAWQAYGDTAREIVADLYPPLAWLAPGEPVAKATAPAVAAVAPATSETSSADLQRLEAMSLSLAAVRQRLDQLSAQLAYNQQQTVAEIAKLQSAQEDMLRKTSAPPPAPAAAPARRPVQARPEPSTQALPTR